MDSPAHRDTLAPPSHPWGLSSLSQIQLPRTALRASPSVLLALLLAACGSAPLPVVITPSPSSSPPEPTTSRAPAVASARAPAAPTAADRVRAALSALTPLSPEDAAWLPMRLLTDVEHATGELPAPAAPTRTADGEVWSLVMPVNAQSRDADAYRAVCTDVQRAEPRVGCAIDTLAIGATDRVRVALGWRTELGPYEIDRGTPLRALARLSTGICVVSVELTPHTVEIRLFAPEMRSLGVSLALLAVAPRLSDMILVELAPMQLASGRTGFRAMLSWPTDRASEAPIDLHDDAWPTRCGEHAIIAGDAPAHAPLAVLEPIHSVLPGAIVSVAHRAWAVAEGDVVARQRVVRVTPRAVWVVPDETLHARAHPRALRFPPSAAPMHPTATPSSSAPTHTVHIPLPPEPPAPIP